MLDLYNDDATRNDLIRTILEQRNAQLTSFTNQTSRMAYDWYRADVWDIGSGMIESACKAVIGQCEKGPGMRWTEAGALAVTNVRLLLFNDAWTDFWAAA